VPVQPTNHSLSAYHQCEGGHLCPWGDEWARHGDPDQLGHRDNGRGHDIEAVAVWGVHVIAIKETVVQTTRFCPLVMPYELEMPGRRSHMGR